MKKILTLFLIVGSISSCVNTKKTGLAWVYRNQTVYKVKDQFSSTKLETLTVDKGTKAKVEVKDNHLKVTFDQTPSSTSSESKTTLNNYPYYHFPLTSDRASRRFCYMEMSPVFQGVTIPFKIRPRLNSKTYYSIETGVSAGFAVGYKFKHINFKNQYFTNGEFMKTHSTSFTLAPSGYAGLSSITLSPETTRDNIDYSRTAIGLNTGLMFVGGVNKFNLGFGMGWDFALSSEGKHWHYQGRPYYGIIIGLEFIK